ncbi:MAG: hypothetical protein ACYS15_04960 [Planctomycetota bacterium]|jgi:hypothetical protein
MDAATALVRLYLHSHAYFAVTDYPIIEAVDEEHYRSVTDVDILAVRLPGAGRIITHQGRGRKHDERIEVVDPELAPSDDRIDMIIAEVKEGEAELNRGAREPAVLRGALTRFGKIKPDETEAIVDELLRKGEATSASGPRVRLMAFGSYRGRNSGGYKVITLKHVLDFLETMMRENWKALRHAQFKDPAINFISVLEKARKGRR